MILDAILLALAKIASAKQRRVAIFHRQGPLKEMESEMLILVLWTMVE